MSMMCKGVVLSFVLLSVTVAHATPRYVNLGNALGAAPPYESPGTAATNIQDAVDVSVDGDTIWVEPGTYGLPTNRVVAYGTTNVVDIRIALTLRSSSGDPADTIIQGDGKYRGLFLYPPESTTILVDGFTVSNCWASAGSYLGGGGMFLFCGNSRTTIVQNCVIKDNTSAGSGAGVLTSSGGPSSISSYTLMSNCVFQGNQSTNGVGAAVTGSVRGSATQMFFNCSIISNRSYSSGAVSGSALNFNPATAKVWFENCEIAYNFGTNGIRAAVFSGTGNTTMRNCSIHHNDNPGASLPSAVYLSGTGANLTLESCLIALNSGNGVAFWDHDESLKAWNTLFYGDSIYIRFAADNFTSFTNCLLPTSFTPTNGANNVFSDEPIFVDASAGDMHLYAWSPAVDKGINQPSWMTDGVDLDGNARIGVSGLVDIGPYEKSGQPMPDYYVGQNGQIPQHPYTNWTMAASNIQDAVDALVVTENGYLFGGTVWVAPGTYTLPPNATNYADSANVVYINKLLTLRSSNGVPESTIIDGQGAYRGIAVNQAGGSGMSFVLDGLTIRDGLASNKGGGVLFDPDTKAWTALVRNCIIRDNTAFGTNGTVIGGGIAAASSSGFGLIVSNCVVQGNLSTNTEASTTGNYPSRGGGIYLSTSGDMLLSGCVLDGNRASYGGGAYTGPGVVIEDSTIRNNHAFGTANGNAGGGGFEFPNGYPYTVRNCLLYNNSAAYRGGAIYKMGSTGYTSHTYVASCTIVNNTGSGGMISVRRNGTLHLCNSIVYDSSISGVSEESTYTNNWIYGQGVVNGVNGVGNITNGVGPFFADLGNGDLRLTADSPCVNSGFYLPWMDGAFDLDGNPRIDGVFHVVDMGCYEYVYRGTSITVR